MFDEDIKIAGEKFTQRPKPNTQPQTSTSQTEDFENAKRAGVKLAEKIVKTAAVPWGEEQDDSFDLKLQRGLLLAFSAVVTVEALAVAERVKDIIKHEFYKELSKQDAGLYRGTTDSGAFSFYYLAHRRGIDVERRIGQTFAMLCSHDGDPIYQELGEALFCSMQSKTMKIIAEFCIIIKG
ncbi:MAG: hypothetical protein IKV36_03535 [Clostridia bacterium]|nr:hypothetical protein [Clostridia bacterium]